MEKEETIKERKDEAGVNESGVCQAVYPGVHTRWEGVETVNNVKLQARQHVTHKSRKEH